MRIHLQTTVHYECAGCGATAPAVMESGITGDDLDISAHEDALRSVVQVQRDSTGSGSPLGTPSAWLLEHLPPNWRVTVVRYGHHLRAWITCSQDCVDRVLGRTPETKSAFVEAEPEPIRGDHTLDYEWRRAIESPPFASPHSTNLQHLFPIVGDRATDGALCDPDLRVARGSLGNRLTTNQWVECSDCHRLRDGLDDAMGPDD